MVSLVQSVRDGTDEYEFFPLSARFLGEESPYLFLVCLAFSYIVGCYPSVSFARDMVACPCACTRTYALFINVTDPNSLPLLILHNVLVLYNGHLPPLLL